MNVLIVGGAGYIGSHTTLALKEKNYNTIIYDSLSKGYRDLIFSDTFIQGDIHDVNLLTNVLNDYNIDAIIHFAAFIEAGESMKSPEIYFHNNSEGSLRLLQAMLNAGVHKIIFSSTAALYGMPDSIPIKEDSPLIPVNAYGESKLIVEKVLQWYSQIHNLKFISLRYFNACGADPQLRTGEKHNPETHLIPIAIQTAYGQREKMFINGIDYDTEDGSCIRDYIHVTDLAKAHVLALEHLMNGGDSDIFNLGSQTGYSVRVIIDHVREISGRDFQVEEGPRRPGDPPVLIASSEKIKRVLGWQPEFTDLREIIQTAIDYHRKINHV